MKILITGATGMFGGALVRQLAGQEGHVVKALVRSLDKAKQQGLNQLKNIRLVVGDLEKPDTLESALEGIDRVFLVSPMKEGLDTLEINLIEAAQRNGVKQIFKLYGAVKHKGDYLIELHNRSLRYLKDSGLKWTLISPNSVMESSFFPLVESIKEENAIYGCTSRHRVGFIALNDVVKAAAKTLITHGHEGKDYQLTGPESLNLYEVAERFSEVLEMPVRYIDLSEKEFEEILFEALGKSRKEIEIEVMCHMRAWNEDGADLVTDTFEKITGEKPTSVSDWIRQHSKAFQLGVT